MTELKQKIIESVVANLRLDLSTIERSAKAAHEAATHEEGKAEDPYDTRGIEASYLAGAQARRAAELQELIQRYEHLELRRFSPEDSIAVTALIEIESSGKTSHYFLVPTQGGGTVRIDDKTIHILSSSSPLGSELVGRTFSNPSDREFEFDISPSQTREYTIVSVY
ncbi:MAG: hypothetical protein KGQ59_02855 [Bdellovibrionales bacterium]|nr:hypothetical protein [Bdellovibrionales bacterium]